MVSRLHYAGEQMNRASARSALTSYLEAPLTRLLARLGVSPNLVSLLGLVAAGGSAYLLSTERLWPGGVVLLASGVFDILDGALARATGRVSSFGALLDSVVDRVSEMVVLLGLLVFFIQRSTAEGMVLVYLALAASVMVSYLRARAEGLGIDGTGGIMTRPERVAILGVGLILGHWWLTAVLAALAAIAALAIVTSGQRLLHTRQMLKGRE